jgi:hypothetical protein
MTTERATSTAQREQTAQAPAPAEQPEQAAGLVAPELGSLTAPGDADDQAARHAQLLADPRLLQRTGTTRRAAVVRQIQRGYGNQHVARALARAGDQAPQRREAVAEPASGADEPTTAEKEAALKAAEAAEQQAVATRGQGADQASQAKGQSAEQKAAGASAKAQAAAASSAAKAKGEQGAKAQASVHAERPQPQPKGAGQDAEAQPAGAGSADKAPASHNEDAAFQAVAAKARGAAGKQRSHPSAASKAAEAQGAAEAPAGELTSKAQANQADKMQQAEAPPFDAAGFKAKLMERIAALAPKSAQEADSLKESDRLGGLKDSMQGSVAQEQQKSRGPLQEASAAAPDPSGVVPKPVTPLEPNEPGPPPAPLGAEAAAPKPRTAAEVEQPIKDSTRQIDQQMAEADVGEATLKTSNEPEFQAALDARGEAKAHAESGPQEFRQGEQDQLGKARGEAQASAQERMQDMHGERAQVLAQVGGKQAQAKGKDEQERARIAADIQSIYGETKASVDAKLGGLDAKVSAAFDAGASAAKKTFEDYVDSKMKAYKQRRYGGWFGWARWAKDKIAGMPGEVNAFYSQGRELYLREMDAVIDRVVAIIGATISEARAEVARGRERIKAYVAELPANLRKVGQEAADGVEAQWQDLEGAISSKCDQLIDSMAQKYQENLQAVDARIEELKAANQGLVQKALNAVVGVIKTILQLKDMLLNVLAKVASAVGKIIKDPIGFLGNLIGGVKQGLQNFLSNIGGHLEKGLIGWLFGELAEGGVEMPQSFDLKGILSLVMQLLGLTWQSIRAQAARMLGEPVVAAMEGTFGIFKTIKEQGLGGLWEFIKEQVGNLEELVMGSIKDLVITQVIQSGIQWLIGILGGPAGAFIKAAKAIYDIVMWFVNNASKVGALIGAFIDSIGAIASGSVDQAAKFIEETLARAIPVVIGFLASLLGLGNLSSKIKGVIEKVRAPIQKAVGWVLGKARGFAQKLGGKVKGLAQQLGGNPESEAEKQKRLRAGVGAGVAAVNKLQGKPLSAALLKGALGAIKLRYRLGLLEPVVQDKKWAVHGELQRMVKPSDLGVEEGEAGSVSEEVQAIFSALQGSPTEAVGEREAKRLAAREQQPKTRLSTSSASFSEKVLLSMIDAVTASDTLSASKLAAAKSRAKTTVSRKIAAARDASDGDTIFRHITAAQSAVNKLLKDQSVNITLKKGLETHHQQEVSKNPGTFPKEFRSRTDIPDRWRDEIQKWAEELVKSVKRKSERERRRRAYVRDLSKTIRDSLVESKAEQSGRSRALLSEVDMIVVTQPAHKDIHRNEISQD